MSWLLILTTFFVFILWWFITLMWLAADIEIWLTVLFIWIWVLCFLFFQMFQQKMNQKNTLKNSNSISFENNDYFDDTISTDNNDDIILKDNNKEVIPSFQQNKKIINENAFWNLNRIPYHNNNISYNSSNEFIPSHQLSLRFLKYVFDICSIFIFCIVTFNYSISLLVDFSYTKFHELKIIYFLIFFFLYLTFIKYYIIIKNSLPNIEFKIPYNTLILGEKSNYKILYVPIKIPFLVIIFLWILIIDIFLGIIPNFYYSMVILSHWAYIIWKKIFKI